MKVFISWSGDRSRAVAEALKIWIKCVLQASQPWISTRDIDRGAIWFSEIQQQLNETSVGIVCLTAENKNKPWILFEAGALAKGLANRVCTLLVDLDSRDIGPPLSSFNDTKPTKEGMFELARTLNAYLGAAALDEIVLERVFEAHWRQFESDFTRALEDYPAGPSVARDEKDVLGEILEVTRGIAARVTRLESEGRNAKLLPGAQLTNVRYRKLSDLLPSDLISEANRQALAQALLAESPTGTTFSVEPRSTNAPSSGS